MFNPQFTITNTILNRIGRIEAAVELIHQAPVVPLWEKEFRQDAIVRQVHHGTHIEGNQLGLQDAKDVLMGKDVVGRPRDIQEVINYRKVIEILDDVHERHVEKITEMFIFKLHRTLMDKILTPDLCGAYRKKSVIIRNSHTGEITFRPPEPLKVPFFMSEFIIWLNRTTKDELHPILKAGIAHHEMARIHPFVDGNGRVSRIAATIVLMLGGYDMRKFFSLEEFYDKDAESYYKALQQASEGNMTAWLEYFVLGASVEFDRIRDKILKLSQDVKLKTKMGGRQVFLTERQIKIVEYMTDVGYIQNKMFAMLFPDVSDDTVLREVNELTQKGLIRKVGSTKGARYELI
ncbi:MAG TPA: Fic family protein [Candidatus Woesebacteria bacterium]|nr:Fic family protein [Candidatus Woesebacteria bacterium]HNS94790.1 Fic family protein [Candidatus Woesebacteria bacterium]